MPNNSISVISTNKFGTGTTESYIQLIENVGIDFRGVSTGTFLDLQPNKLWH